MSTSLGLPARLAIVRYHGDGPISIPLVHPDTGDDFTPTAYVLLFTIKASYADEDAAAKVQKLSTVGGITLANPAVVTLVGADFAVLERNFTYQFDIQAQPAGGGVPVTVARGTIRFEYDITREVTLSVPSYTSEPESIFPLDGPVAKRGTVSLAVDDEAKAVAFTTPFSAAPSQVLVTFIAPSDGTVIGFSVDASPTASGFTVRLAAPVPAAGYKLHWLALL